MDENYYSILGVNRNASPSEIQKAYRSLARKYHPDVNPDDNAAKEKFQEVQKAYDVLNDPEKKKMYDQYGSAFESMGAGGGPGAGPWRGSSGGVEVDFSDLFGGGQGGASINDLFGGMFGQGVGGRAQQRPPRRARGADLKHELEVPLNTAVTGGEARINVQRPDGNVESLAVKIPAGIEDGKSIRLRGQGQPGRRGGPAGDILIKVKVAPHPCFRRRANNLEVDVPVTLAEAALGAKIDVPTPKGTITLSVPPGTSSGKKLRVKGHGVQAASGAAGDLFAQIQIVLPKSLDEESADLIRQLAKRDTTNPRADLRWA